MIHFFKYCFALVFLALFLPLASVYGQTHTSKAGDRQGYKVVINHEEQYSIWITGRENPVGWKDTGKQGSQKECLAYIEEVWTDMRPLSIRKMNLPDNSRYKVVINHEEQYSIWPARSGLSKGWKAAGKQGNLKECTAYIEEVWTDMRPLSLRKMMEGK